MSSPAGTSDDDRSGDSAATAVVAHGLLGNLAVIRGATQMLSRGAASEEDERALFGMIASQVDLMEGLLSDLVRGLPRHALAALDDLGRAVSPEARTPEPAPRRALDGRR